ncbi:MAG: hypothetical protein M3P18_08745 [Actinomycetota bacterium]|nr:hypothetical protein [Actinomycetota bacterium]
MADPEPQAASHRKDGRQNALVHEPVTGPSPPYDHNLVADSKIKVLQPDGVTPAPRWDARGKYALPTHRNHHPAS